MKAIILGAGASKSYKESKTKIQMPIAKDFFQTFRQLKIAENPWVLIGHLLNYLEKFKGINIPNFENYVGDIEDIHSEIEEKLSKRLQSSTEFLKEPNNMLYLKAYNELVFLFISVINEIQNGPISKSHINLAEQLNNEDTVITFNWDTLMDRALNETTDWNASTGYYVKPKMIYRDNWEEIITSETKRNHPLILKLHGSSNWLTSHTIPENQQLRLLQETPPEEFFIYESNIAPYSTYDGRYMDGYEDFSYGYYPPNLPVKGKSVPKGKLLIKMIPRSVFKPKGLADSHGLVSMPLIIPPVKNKEYSKFGNLFSDLWSKAKKSLEKAEQIVIIGYSFPKTDYRTDLLFKEAFVKRKDMPKVIILNPQPESIVNRFVNDFGITMDKITIIKDYFSDNFDFNTYIK